MNKHFHNYTTQTRKVKENYGNKKEAPAGGFFFANAQICVFDLASDFPDQIKIYFRMNSTASTYISTLIFFSFALPVTTLMIT